MSYEQPCCESLPVDLLINILQKHYCKTFSLTFNVNQIYYKTFIIKHLELMTVKTVNNGKKSWYHNLHKTIIGK